MAKKDGITEDLSEQAQIMVAKDEDFKSPPVSYRTRRGRSKIPSKVVELSNEDKSEMTNITGKPEETGKSEKEYSSDEESPEEEPEQAANIDSAKAEKNADEVIAMSNDQLKERLTTLGIVIGPLVPSTRKIYEKKLINLMNKADLQYSTDEDETVGAIAEEVRQESPAKKVRGRPKREEATVQDKFSDDEDDLPVVKNSSSARRRSTRHVKKLVEQVTVEEPISEEIEVQVENGSDVLVVENGTGDAIPDQVKETVIEEPVMVEEEESPLPEMEESEEVVPQLTQTARPIPYHTIAVILIISILIALIWQQRDQHILIVESGFNWIVSEYTRLYDSLMPDVEQLPPVEA